MVRFKNRYFLIELCPSDNFPPEVSNLSIANFIRKTIHSYFGIYGSALNSLALSVKYSNSNTCLCIVRCARNQEKMFKECISLMKHWPSSKSNEVLHLCKWKILYISGTMKLCQTNAIALIKSKMKYLSGNSFEGIREALLSLEP